MPTWAMPTGLRDKRHSGAWEVRQSRDGEKMRGRLRFIVRPYRGMSRTVLRFSRRLRDQAGHLDRRNRARRLLLRIIQKFECLCAVACGKEGTGRPYHTLLEYLPQSQSAAQRQTKLRVSQSLPDFAIMSALKHVEMYLPSSSS
jgi:hypothetical protein